MKYIIYLLLITYSIFSGENGWVPVEQPAQSFFEQKRDDPSIWVVLRKNIDLEQFLVRFPEEPSCRLVDGQLQISASRDGEEFQLTVFPLNNAPDWTDRTYQIDGKWISEQVRITEMHAYLFRTISEQAEPPAHRYFFESFSTFS